MVLEEMTDFRAETGKVQSEPGLSMLESKGVVKKIDGDTSEVPRGQLKGLLNMGKFEF